MASAVLVKATSAATGSGSRSRSSLECGVRGYAAHLVYPLRTSPRSWRPTSRPCAPPRVPLRVVRLVEASNVIGDATAAAPSRAWPRRNSPCTTRRAAGQRRITARVMRSFGRRLPHTLPFPAHPRVASRPKSPAPAVATLFGLPATLRAGTESVLFPWRCSRQGRALWVVRTSPQNATRHARAAYRP